MTTTTAAAAASPVINFAESAVRKRKKSTSKQPNHPDADLIECCIEYGMQIAGAQICYAIDPTDSGFAALSDDIAQGRARRALIKALDHPPQTLDGLRAKTALIAIILDDWAGDLDKLDVEFLTSIANDVKRFQMSPLLRDHVVPVSK